MKKSYKQFIASLSILALGILGLILVKAYYPEGYDVAKVLLFLFWGLSVWGFMSPDQRKKFLGDGPSARKQLKLAALIMVVIVVVINVFNLGR